jgi:3-oxoacyl-[acyl-carrier protein] reductase
MSTLQGRTALVTGASRGIGQAIARRLAADGAIVAVHYRQGRLQAEETVSLIEQRGGKAFAVSADLMSIRDIDTLFEMIKTRFGTLDILVNNAGVSHTAYIEDTSPEDFDRIIATNLRGPYFVTKQALTMMKSSGRIINISSNSTRVAYPEVSVYGLTKAAIQNFTLSLAQQLGKRGITVNTLVPGVIDTDMNSDWLSEAAKVYVIGQTSLGRLGSVEEVANVAAFLASDESSWVTGQSIEASGGCRL